MHFTLDRRARAAKTPSAILHASFLPSRLSYTSSERRHKAEDHMTMSSERRSMPCLRLPVAKSSKGLQSKKGTSSIERPASAASTASSRRSVSGMKQLLPLKLQPNPPLRKADLSSWLDNAVLTLKSLTAFDFESTQGSPKPSHFPWMWSSQDVQLSHDLHPDRYRETPVYSEPGSPMLARAYFSGEDSCYQCLPPGSTCDELCIVSGYEGSRTIDSHGQVSSLDCTEGSDDEGNGTAETPPTSFASSRLSGLSIQCQGGYATPSEAAWLRSNSNRWNKGMVGKVDNISGETERTSSKILPAECWIDSESSRCSSPASFNEVLDAFATKLAPAKAHVINMSKSPPLCSEYPPRSTPLWPRRPSTPPTLPPRRIMTLGSPSITNNDMDGDDTLKQKRHRVPTRSPLSNLQFDLAIAKSPTYDTKRIPWHRSGYFGTDESRDFIDAICNAVQSFPLDMLTLDTPCVVDMRRLNNPVRHLATAQQRSNPSCCSSDYPRSSAQRPRRYLRRRTKPAGLLSPLKHPNRSTASTYTSQLSQPPPPDLSAFRNIFPSTDDWWRSILYSHLIAYNYIRDAQAEPRYLISDIPSKASCTLGIPRGSSFGRFPVSSSDARIAEVENELALCITRISNCMAGKSNALRDTEEIREVKKGDCVLVRALAEVLKASERSGYGEVEMAMYG